ncbi:hypothetical protein C8237_15230 [Paracidovorax avenae]|uniref:DUF4265 domain-containing protein n=1 Tax=Paracidovorax avenae TaxID=80867 RepID=UPI000D203E38|nr:DUF4265 domain-containing protein [Paracidovorax avenae]AVS82297.1 hypothetical protein C8237_15230 [Paracidovorax avenae]
MEDRTEIIRVFAGKNQHGNVYEELPAKKISNDTYSLLASPGLVLGLAKGDLVHLNGDHHNLVKHGGNFCIQMYAPKLDQKSLEKIKSLLQPISGTLDGQGDGALAFSVPTSSGFSATNEAFDKIREVLGSEYYYSNIYRDATNTDDEELTEWAKELLNKED